jgi:hypothetical protein
MPVNAPGSQLTAEGERPGWARLRAVAGGPAVWLCGDRPGWAGICQLCRGPARPGRSLCFQCDLQAQSAPGSLADAVVPIAYAVKGGGHARDLWTYKSGGPAAAEAGLRLAVLLALFLREHGSCLWRAAGICGPTHVGVVPSGRGRAGTHPLRALVQPCTRLPWADLTARPGGSGGARDLAPGRFRAARLARARVLLLDDTWTSGASAQSAVMALRRAGAGAVAVIVLGRHLAAGPDPARNPADLPRPGLHRPDPDGRPVPCCLPCAAGAPAPPAVRRPGGPGST